MQDQNSTPALTGTVNDNGSIGGPLLGRKVSGRQESIAQEPARHVGDQSKGQPSMQSPFSWK